MTAAYDSEIFEKIFSRFGFDQTVPMWKLIVVMLLRLVVSRHSIIITSGQRLHNVFFPFYFPFPNRRFFFFKILKFSTYCTNIRFTGTMTVKSLAHLATLFNN